MTGFDGVKTVFLVSPSCRRGTDQRPEGATSVARRMTCHEVCWGRDKRCIEVKHCLLEPIESWAERESQDLGTLATLASWHWAQARVGSTQDGRKVSLVF